MPANTEHYVGGTKHFECRVKGHPRPEIRWFKDGKDITDNPRFKFAVTHGGVVSMVIDNIIHDDEGHYRCRAENSEGIASTSAYLFVRSHKDHPEEAETSIHSMNVEEAIIFNEKEKAKRKQSKSKIKEPHFKTPIQDTEEVFSRARRLSTEEKEIVKKTFESIIESSASIRQISSQIDDSTASSSAAENGEEIESAKIKADISEKNYHSSDESMDDVDSLRLKTISERSETASSIQEALLDFERQEKSLLMKNTARILSTDMSDEDHSRISVDFDSESESVFSSKASLKSQIEMVSSKVAYSKHEESSSKDGKSVITSQVSSMESVEVHAVKRGKDDDMEETHQAASSVQAVKKTQMVEDTKVASSMKSDSAQEYDEDAESITESETSSSIGSVVGVEVKAKPTKDGEKMDKDKDVPHFTMRPKDIHIYEYDDMKLSCEVQGKPRPALTWFKNGNQLRSNRRTRLYESLGMHYLEIRDCDAQDVGEYVCLASSSKGEASASVRVTMEGVSMERRISESLQKITEEEKVEEKQMREVKSAPKVVDNITDTTVKAGETIKLEIRIKGSPQPIVSWSKEGKKLKSGERISVSHEKEVCILEIHNARASDSGYYHMSARNDLGDTSTDVRVTVSGEAKKKSEEKKEKKVLDVPEFTVAPKGLMFAEYEDIKLSCEVMGDPKPTIQWEKDGKPLRSNRRTKLYESMGVSYLEVKDCDDLDIGEYTCVATNSKGTTKHSVQVTMEGMTVEVRSVSEEKVEFESITEGKEEKKEEKEIPSAPKVVDTITDTTVKAAETLKLEIRIKGFPQPLVSWSKEGKKLKSGDRITISQENEIYILEIHNVRASDSGYYRLFAGNDLGDTSTDVKVTVSGEAKKKTEETKEKKVVDVPEFTTVPKDVMVAEYDDIKLSCEVTGDPKPTIQWEKDGKPLRSNRRTKLYESMGVSYLEVKDCDDLDIGEYTCVATNSKGTTKHSVQVTMEGVTAEVRSASEEKVQVDSVTELKEERKEEKEIQSAPKVVDVITDATVTAGETVKLELRIKGSPEPIVSWSKEGKKLKSGEKITISQSKEVCTLEIHNARASDSGYYHMTARNDLGDTSTDVKVTVSGDAKDSKKTEKKKEEKVVDVPEFTTAPMDLMVAEYEDIKLSCEVIGDPKPTIQWEKDGKPLRSNRRTKLYESLGVSYLEVKDCDDLDIGEYTCVATNSKGTTKHSVQVTMEGVTAEVRSASEEKVQVDSVTELKEERKEEKEIQSAPKVVDVITDVAATTGETVKLELRIKGSPEPIVSWSKEGKKLKSGEKITISQSKEVCTLEIHNARASDSGYYHMTARNDLGDTSTDVKVTVSGDAKDSKKTEKKKEEKVVDVPEFTTAPMDLMVAEYEDIKLSCEVIGDPKPTIQWEKDGKPLRSNRRTKLYESLGVSYLEVKDCDDLDIGEYTCVATNSKGTTKHSVQVTMEGMTKEVVSLPEEKIQTESVSEVKEEKETQSAPKLVDSGTDSTVKAGETVKLELAIKGSPQPIVSWSKEGKKLKSGDRITISQSEEVCILEIHNARASDSGYYHMSARNDLGDTSTDVKVTVSGDAKKKTEEKKEKKIVDVPEFTSAPESMKIGEYDDIKLSCQVIGDPKPTIQWEKDGKPMRSNRRTRLYESMGVSYLEIKDCDVHDIGEYTCIATNRRGSVQHSVQVTMDGVQTDITSSDKPEIESSLEPVDEADSKAVTDSQLSLQASQEQEEFEVVETVDGELDETPGKQKVRQEKEETPTKPVIVDLMKDQSLEAGKTLKLTTQIKGIPEPTVSWSKDGQVLSQGERIRITAINGFCTLEIHNVKESDSGTYSLAAISTSGEIYEDMIVSITGDTTSVESIEKKSKRPSPEVDSDVPQFTMVPQDVSLTLYEDIQLSCSVSGDPAPKITWEKDGQKLRSNRRTRINESMGVHYLTIREFDALDEGEYVCTATNSKGSAKATVRVRMAGIKDDRTKRKDDGPYDDRDIKLQRVSFSEDVQEEIYTEQIITDVEDKAAIKNGEVTMEENIAVTESVEKMFTGANETSEEIVVEEDKVEDIFLVATEAEERLSMEKQSLESQGLPEITEKVDDVSITPGSSLKLKVQFKGSTAVSWSKDGKALKEGRKINMMVEDGECLLEILDASPSDAGTYTMTASSSLGEVSTDIHVTLTSDVSTSSEKAPDDKTLIPVVEVDTDVDVDAPRFTVLPESVSVSMYEDVKLSCSVSGNPAPRITWEKDGQKLRSNRRTRMNESMGVNYLTVREFDALDEGEYVCTATNSKGSAKATVRVRMAGTEEEEDTKGIDDGPYDDKDIKLKSASAGKESQEVEKTEEIGKLEGAKVEIKQEEEEISAEAKISKTKQQVEETTTLMKEEVVEEIFTQEKEVAEETERQEKKATAKKLSAEESVAIEEMVTESTEITEKLLEEKKGKLEEKKTADTEADKLVAKMEQMSMAAESESVVTESVQDISLTSGSALKLKAMVEGLSEATVSWTKDGKTLKEGKKIKMTAVEGEYMLEMEDVSPDDAGTYTMTASSSVGEVSTTMQVTVTGDVSVSSIEETIDDKTLTPVVEVDTDVDVDAPRFTVLPESVSASMYEDVKLSCSVSGNPAPRITWEKDGQRLRSNRRTRMNESMGVNYLTVREFDALDEGEYVCTATNSKGSAKATVRVRMAGTEEEEETKGIDDGPYDDKDIKLKSASTGKESQEVEKTEEIGKLEGATVDIKQEEEEISAEAKISKTKQQVEETTTLMKEEVVEEIFTQEKEVAEETERQEKKATAKKLSAEESVTIEEMVTETTEITEKLLEEKKGKLEEKKTADTEADKLVAKMEQMSMAAESESVVTESVQDISLTSGSALKLKAMVEGLSEATVSWTKDGKTLKEGEKIKMTAVEGEYVLEMEDVSPDDAGTYTMTASSSVGEVSTTMQVTVTGDVSVSSTEKTTDDKTLTPVVEVDTDVDVDAPRFTVLPESVSVSMYEDVKLSCSVSGNPAPRITWEKDGQRLRSNRRTRMNESMGVNYLTVREFDALDEGEYVCTATNSKGSAKATVRVRMAGTEEEEDTRGIDDGPYDDKDIKLKSASTGKESQEVEKTEEIGKLKGATVEIKQEEEEISAEAKISKTKQQVEETTTLMKEEVVEEIFTQEKEVAEETERQEKKATAKKLSAEESVAIEDMVTESTEITEKLLEEKKGKLEEKKTADTEADKLAAKTEQMSMAAESESVVTESVQDISLTSGSALKLKAMVEGLSEATVSWTKDGKTLKEGEKIKMTAVEGEYVLEMEDVSPDDAGTYTMTASSSVGEVSTTMQVTVTGDVSVSSTEKTTDDKTLTPVVEVDTDVDVDAPRFTVLPESVSVSMYEDVKLSCSVSGNPAPRITWEKDGQRLRSNRRTRMNESMGVNYLTVREFDALDEGEYVCTATNSKGSAKATVRVRMAGTEEEEDTKGIDNGPYDDKDIKLKSASTGKESQEVEKTEEIGKLEGATVEINQEEEEISAEAKISKTKQQVEETTTLMKEEVVEEIFTQEKEVAEETERQEKKATAKKLSAEESVAIEEMVTETTEITEKLLEEKKGKLEEKKTADTEADKLAAKTEQMSMAAESESVVTESVQDISLTSGSALKLKAMVEGLSEATVSWTKDGKTLKEGEKIKMTAVEGEYVLEMEDVSPDDAGTYTMTASSSVGEVSTTMQVTVTGDVSVSSTEKTTDDKTLTPVVEVDTDVDVDAPRFTVLPESVSVSMYEDVKLSCSVSGNPAPRITWEKDGQRLRSNRRTRMNESMGVHYLTVREFDALDEGEYVCTATNSKGSAKATVRVRMAGTEEEEDTRGIDDGPYDDKDIKLKSASTGKESQEVEKTEEIGKLEGATVDIKQEEEEISAEAKISKTKQQVEETTTLMKEEVVEEIFTQEKEVAEETERQKKKATAKKLSAEESVAIEEMVTESTEITEKLLEEKKGKLEEKKTADTEADKLVAKTEQMSMAAESESVVTESVQDISLTSGSALKLKAMVEGLSEATVSWTKDGKTLKEGEKIKMTAVEGEYVLEMEDVSPDDAGTYTMTASSSVGEVSTTMQVTVTGDVSVSSTEKTTDDKTLTPVVDIDVDVDAPRFTVAPESIFVAIYEDIKLSCSVTGNPAPRITWEKDGQKLRSNRRTRMNESMGVHYLTVREFDALDEGEYVCTATNSKGSAKATVRVRMAGTEEEEEEKKIDDGPYDDIDIKLKKALDEKKLQEEELERTQLIQITEQDAVVVRQEDEIAEAVVTKQRQQVEEQTIGSLKEEVVEQEMEITSETLSQRKESIVEETAMKGKEEVVEEMVSEKDEKLETRKQSPTEPKIVEKMEDDVSVESGSSLKLKAKVEGSPEPSVSWSKDGKAVKEREGIKMMAEEGECVLEIQEVSSSDAGTYTMTASSALGQVSTDMRVTITSDVSVTSSEKATDDKTTTSVVESDVDADAPKFTVAPQNISVSMSEDIKLSCSVKGDPQPRITWEKDSKRMRSNRRNRLYESMGVNYLEIRDCDALDLGEYVCTASNYKGTVSATVTVTMEGMKPSSPTPEEPSKPVLEAQEKEEQTKGESTSDLLDGKLDDKLEKTDEVMEQTLKLVDQIEPSKSETVLTEEGMKMEEVEELKIVEKLEDVAVELGTTLTLQTQIRGPSQATASWSKDGSKLQEGERITMGTEDDVYTLNIHEVESTDSGRYRLTAHSTSGDVFSDVTVTVVGDGSVTDDQTTTEQSITIEVGTPQFTAVPQGVITVPEFEAIKLSCGVKGDPKPSVTWKKDGKRLQANRRLRLHESQGIYYLEIPDSDAMDAGEYVCSATNNHGTITTSVRVMIEGMDSSISTAEEAEDLPINGLMATGDGTMESSTDVRNSDSRTIRYMKLVGAATAFSLAAMGLKRVMENLHK